MMEDNDYDYDKLKEAGRVSRAALDHAKTLIKPGKRLVDIASEIERLIKDRGCAYAFPINLSTNAQAAHYTPEHSDQAVIGEKDVIKIDLGARIDDYLTDCAATVSLDPSYSGLVDATEKALDCALGLVRAGCKVNEIGREIAGVAAANGFSPIRNLGGHAIERDELHARIFIPNYDNGDTTQLREGEVVAIEPFLTTGKGVVGDGEHLQIFQMIGDRMPRSPDARSVLEHIAENFSTFPFAMRWLIADLDWEEFRVRKALAELRGAGDLEEFPVLVEKSAGMVAQAEKTVVVGKDTCTVIT